SEVSPPLKGLSIPLIVRGRSTDLAGKCPRTLSDRSFSRCSRTNCHCLTLVGQRGNVRGPSRRARSMRDIPPLRGGRGQGTTRVVGCLVEALHELRGVLEESE